MSQSFALSKYIFFALASKDCNQQPFKSGLTFIHPSFYSPTEPCMCRLVHSPKLKYLVNFQQGQKIFLIKEYKINKSVRNPGLVPVLF